MLPAPVASGDLAAFVAAYESGSLQGAADALSLTQSAVTKRVQALERRLGARVLERGRLGVRPTALGQAIYPPAKQALRQLDAVSAAAAVARDSERADLRLSASHTIGEFLLPEWLSEFRLAYPEVHPQLEVGNSAGALAALRDGRCAVAFIESGEDVPRGVEAMTVATDSLAVVVSGTHRWAGRRRGVAAAELSTEAYFTRERDSGTRAVATAALAAAGVELTAALEVASIESLKRMITGGRGFTILSRLAIAEEERAGGLVGLPVRGVDLSRELRAVRSRRRGAAASAGPAARRFWTWLADRRERGG